MRILALDYGSARCGCAVSDPTGTLASPLAAIPRPGTRRGLRSIVALARELGVERIVVGLPIGLRGHDTAQTAEVREFAERLRPALGHEVPVELHDERFTTVIASRDPAGARADEDSRAAAHLLESWLAAAAR